MAYHEGEGGRLSLNHQRFRCAHVQEDKWTEEIICIIGYEEKKKKKKSVKSSSKHTQRSDSPIDSLSVQVSRSGWRGDVCGVPGFEDKWTVTTKNRPQGALPGVCCGLSLLFRSCSSEMLLKPSSATNNFQFNLNNNSNKWQQHKKKKIFTSEFEQCAFR